MLVIYIYFVLCKSFELGPVLKFVLWSVNPLPDDKILDWSELKQSADDNFEFDVNSRKFSKVVENTVGKGEIARYEQFLLFPQCFQKGLFLRGVKRCHCVGMADKTHQTFLADNRPME